MGKLALVASILTLAVQATSLHAGGKLEHIPLSRIKANPVALRAVDKDSEGYKELIESIRAVGVITAISVREKIDPETKEPYYELVDGLHRYTASCDAGKDLNGNAIETIPAQILTATDAQTLELQLIGNIHRIETKPAEYTQQLIRILKSNPTMTEAQLAIKLGKSPAWLNERLGLANLTDEIRPLVDEGLIPLSSAYSLAKLPKDEQPNWKDRAMNMPSPQFVVECSNRKKELDKAARAGRAPEEETFKAFPVYRKLSDAKMTAEDLGAITSLVNKHAANDPVKAAQLGILWALQLDPDTIAERQQKFETEKKRRNEDKSKRAAERKEQRAKENRERADKLEKEAKALKDTTPVGASA